MPKEHKTELEYVRGGTIHAVATSKLMKTGSWRVFRPVVIDGKCNQCQLCHWYCPDASITMAEEGIEIDFDYCKGCGICALECPAQAIVMEREEVS